MEYNVDSNGRAQRQYNGRATRPPANPNFVPRSGPPPQQGLPPQRGPPPQQQQQQQFVPPHEAQQLPQARQTQGYDDDWQDWGVTQYDEPTGYDQEWQGAMQQNDPYQQQHSPPQGQYYNSPQPGAPRGRGGPPPLGRGSMRGTMSTGQGMMMRPRGRDGFQPGSGHEAGPGPAFGYPGRGGWPPGPPHTVAHRPMNTSPGQDYEAQIAGQMKQMDVYDWSGPGPDSRGRGYAGSPRGGPVPRGYSDHMRPPQRGRFVPDAPRGSAPRGPFPNQRGGPHDAGTGFGPGPGPYQQGSPPQGQWDQGQREYGYRPPQDGFGPPSRSATMPANRPNRDLLPPPRIDSMPNSGPPAHGFQRPSAASADAPTHQTYHGQRYSNPEYPGQEPSRQGYADQQYAQEGYQNQQATEVWEYYDPVEKRELDALSLQEPRTTEQEQSPQNALGSYLADSPAAEISAQASNGRAPSGGGGDYGGGAPTRASLDDHGRQRGSMDEFNNPRGSLDAHGRFQNQTLSRSRSQPDLYRSQEEVIYETARDAPPMPTQQQQQQQQQRRGSAGFQPWRPGMSDTTSGLEETSSPPPLTPLLEDVPRPIMEPPQGRMLSDHRQADSMAHPIPVRPINPNERPLPIRNYGNISENPVPTVSFSGSSSGGPTPSLSSSVARTPSQKPAPVRNYNGVSTVVAASQPAPAPIQLQPSALRTRQAPVTAEELERLRLRYRAEQGDKETTLMLAKRLIEACTVLVPQNPDPKTRSRMRDRFATDALKLLKQLTAAQVPEAMFVAADGHGRGLFGGEPNNKEAFALYQSAAKLGHAAAAYRTAVCCEIGSEEGGGTRKDPLKAMQWYKRAATLGDTPAMYKMGMILLKGLLGQPRNPREAVSWLKRAAERADAENPHALHELGLLYESATGDDVLVRDPAYAMQLFNQAAELGYKFSQFRLGCAYEYGLMGVAVDPRLSITWYSKAAMQEEHQSELALSGWYLTGSGGVLGQSDTEAYLWARKAAMAGLAKAEYAMGYFTEMGIGVAANLEDAKRWYWRAAAQEFPKARERLEDIKRSGKTTSRPRERVSRGKNQQEGDCVVM